jgi:deoxyadenosine/deoxycytidine kinase
MVGGENVMFIAVSGSIGAGKSTVTRILAEITGFEPLFETVEGHPYLEKFYKDPKTYAFRTQTFFLWDRFNKHYSALKTGRNIVADRCIYEDAIFAKVQHMRGDMDDDDYLRTYLPHYKILTEIIKPPELMVYLRANLDTLVYRIRKRARDMEKNIDTDYLKTLSQCYEEWILNYPDKKLIIETDDLDLTCDLHSEWLYLVNAILAKMSNADTGDLVSGIPQLVQKLPPVHNTIKDHGRLTAEIFS